MDLLQSRTLLLLITAAIGYAVATFGMKLTAGQAGPDGAFLLVFGFVIAAIAEVIVLRTGSLGALYLAIVGAETLLVLTLAWWLGEGLTPRQVMGGALVLAGMGFVAH